MLVVPSRELILPNQEIVRPKRRFRRFRPLGSHGLSSRRCCCAKIGCDNCEGTKIPQSLLVTLDNLTAFSAGTHCSDNPPETGDCEDLLGSYQVDIQPSVGPPADPWLWFECGWQFVFPDGTSCGARSLWVLYQMGSLPPPPPYAMSCSLHKTVEFSSFSILANWGTPLTVGPIEYPSTGVCSDWDNEEFHWVGGGECLDDDPTNPHCFISAL